MEIHQSKARAQEAQANHEAEALRKDMQRAEGELRDQLHRVGTELAAKTTELARYQSDFSKASALLEGNKYIFEDSIADYCAL